MYEALMLLANTVRVKSLQSSFMKSKILRELAEVMATKRENFLVRESLHNL